MQDFRNLSVWQRARSLTKTVYEITADFPGSEEFGLKSQMRRAMVSVCSNIAEGCGRRGDAEFRRFLDVAMGSACELECETILSFDLAFITESLQERILAALIEIKRMLSGLMQTLVVPARKGQAERGSTRIREAAPTPGDRSSGG
jgi:four helix bundle protein